MREGKIDIRGNPPGAPGGGIPNGGGGIWPGRPNHISVDIFLLM